MRIKNFLVNFLGWHYSILKKTFDSDYFIHGKVISSTLLIAFFYLSALFKLSGMSLPFEITTLRLFGLAFIYFLIVEIVIYSRRFYVSFWKDVIEASEKKISIDQKIIFSIIIIGSFALFCYSFFFE